MADINNLGKIIAVTGHYGSGKTNLAVNLAVDFAKEGERVTIIDLDIVNPYFRTADFSELFGSLGIKLVAPQFANTNLDIPSLGFDMAAVINHTAGGYLFYKTPEYHRISRFRGNGVPMDRPGFYVYIRDNEKKDYHSISWQPVAKDLSKAKYRCRHGLSYTVYESEYDGLASSQTMVIPRGENVLLWDVKVKNTTDAVRNLSLFTYMEFSFHHIMIDNQNFQMSLYCAGSSYEDGIIEEDLFYEEKGYQYLTANFTPDGYDCVREKFLGVYGTEDHSAGLERGTLEGSTELGGNHRGSLQKNFKLQPGEEARFVIMLGEGNREEGRRIRVKYSDLKRVDAVYTDLAAYWKQKYAALQIQTPNEGMNTLINTWTLYQSEINVMFEGR